MKKSFLSLLSALSLVAASLGAISSAQAQDANAGAKKVAMCIGCHGIVGYKTAFPQVYRSPQISGQGAKYIEAALKAYAKGDRKHPSMRGISASLSETDIADIAAFYEAQGKARGARAGNAQAQPGPLAKQVLEAGACVSCHGANFNKPIDPSYPKLGGQYADYLYVALRSYSVEGKTAWGRSHPSMSATLKTVRESFKGNERQFNAALRETAKYLSELPGEMHTVPQAKFR